MLRINKVNLKFGRQEINALCLIPDNNNNNNNNNDNDKGKIAIFCHGYTSHKGSLLNWGTKLTEIGITTVLFDLPGHYLGSFCEAEDFDLFVNETPKLFISGIEYILKNLPHFDLNDKKEVILGGHSLGALLSLKALELDYFKEITTINILVGLGKLPEHSKHIFQSPFYRETLNIRSELVSKAICPDKIIHCINLQKNEFNFEHRKLHFITGENDLVVGKSGSENLIEHINKNNQITLEKIKNLPHHLPEMAAIHIKTYLKQINIF